MEESNYIDLRRTTSISKAWLIERSWVIMVNVAHDYDWWTGGFDQFTKDKNLAIRFTRWIDANNAIQNILVPKQGERFIPTFHRDLIAMASLGNPEGVVHL